MAKEIKIKKLKKTKTTKRNIQMQCRIETKQLKTIVGQYNSMRSTIKWEYYFSFEENYKWTRTTSPQQNKILFTIFE